jgi:hypothetical protein
MHGQPIEQVPRIKTQTAVGVPCRAQDSAGAIVSASVQGSWDAKPPFRIYSVTRPADLKVALRPALGAHIPASYSVHPQK